MDKRSPHTYKAKLIEKLKQSFIKMEDFHTIIYDSNREFPTWLRESIRTSDVEEGIEMLEEIEMTNSMVLI